MSEPSPDPITTRVAGGFSPRLVALALAGVLAAVVWIGLSGRTPAPPQSALIVTPSASEPPGNTVTPPLSPTPSWPPRRTPRPTPPTTVRSGIELGEDAFGVIAFIERRLYLEVLHEIEPGHFTGSFRLPFPTSEDPEATFELAQLWTRDRERLSHVPVGQWPLPLDTLVEDTNQAGTVIEVSVPGRRNARQVPRLVRRGYELVVRAESWYDFGIVTIDVRMRRAQIRGDDGIFGWPAVAAAEEFSDSATR